MNVVCNYVSVVQCDKIGAPRTVSRNTATRDLQRTTRSHHRPEGPAMGRIVAPTPDTAPTQGSLKRPKGAKLARLRVEVFTRDNWTCQDCGKHIPPADEQERTGRYAPVAADLDWLELEHIVPHSRGGSSEAANLRAACTTCNRIKRDSLNRSGWEIRIAEAMRILGSREPSRDTAERAIRVLRDAID